MELQIRPVKNADKDFWMSLDRHLSDREFKNKVRLRQGYVLSVNGQPAGVLRYNLFWDNTPFCTLLYIHEAYRKCGCGSALMNYWEREMRSLGYHLLLVSTQSDESAQYFYRKLGYTDCGTLSVPDQATELFLSKII